MKKLFMVCTLVVLVLSVSSRTQASPTMTCWEWQEVITNTIFEDLVDATSAQDDTYFVPASVPDSSLKDGDPVGKPYFRFSDGDWGWNHTFSPPGLAPTTMNSATLGILAYDVDGAEIDVVKGDGVVLGQLAGSNNAWSTTNIPITGADLDKLLDGTIDIWLDIDSANTGLKVWGVAIGSSTLTVDYDTVEKVLVEVPCPCPVIPAPGAILLSSIGVGVVGWLRRRRTL